MGITELNLIGDFEAGMKCLQNPSILSKLSLIDKVLPQLYSFWTCGALILAVFASFTNVFKRIKLFIHQIRRRFLVSCQNSCPQQIFNDDGDFDFEFSDDDDDGDDDTPSSVAESDDDELNSEDYRCRAGEVFRAEGSGYWVDKDNFRRSGGDGGGGDFGLWRRNRFSWSEFSAGKSVVQLWDSFGLGLDFEDDEIEMEYEKNQMIDYVKLISGKPCAAETVVITAEMDDDVAGVWSEDHRPSICAAWRPRRGKIWSEVDGDGVNQKEE